MPPLDEGDLQRLYAWVDEIPLSRPKRNFTRDFSDGVLVAEIVQHFCPKIIDLHNFSPANATQQKVYNWNTLNQRPFKKLGLQISKADITAVCNCKPNAVEKVLRHLHAKISKYMSRAEALQGQEPLSSMAPAPTDPRAGAVSAEPRLDYHPAHRSPPRRQQPPPSAAPGPGPEAYPQQPPQQPQPATAALPAAGGGGGNRAAIDALELQRQVDTEILIEKEQTIQELRETVEILELKVKKLEQLVRIKDSKIHAMHGKLVEAGLT